MRYVIRPTSVALYGGTRYLVNDRTPGSVYAHLSVDVIFLCTSIKHCVIPERQCDTNSCNADEI